MKVAGHLVLFFVGFSLLDTVLAASLLRVFDPDPTTTATVGVSAFLFAVVVTNGPGGILLRRFYDHHQEHADDVARWLKGLDLKFFDDKAEDTLFVIPEALNPATRAGSPPTHSKRVLRYLVDHIDTGRDYRKTRNRFDALVKAHREFELNHSVARAQLRKAVEAEVKRMWPSMPLAYVNGREHLNLNAIVEAVWDTCWLRAIDRGREVPRVEVEKVGGTQTPMHLRWRIQSWHEHRLAELHEGTAVLEVLQTVLDAQSEAKETVELVQSAVMRRRELESQFREGVLARERTAWRIGRNRDLGGKCDDCPKFFG